MGRIAKDIYGEIRGEDAGGVDGYILWDRRLRDACHPFIEQG
jgi:hypothetical protein